LASAHKRKNDRQSFGGRMITKKQKNLKTFKIKKTNEKSWDNWPLIS
jgi:hypothetical protein